MDRLRRRIAGMGKADKAPAAVQKDNKDESVVFFRELYKREKERDVMNLLDPIYSVEFDAIQGGGHARRVPSGKGGFLIPVDEKHDYDWLKSTPATPLFPSLEMEAIASSQMAFRKEPLVPPRQVKPSASRVNVSARPEATSRTSARPASPTATSFSSSSSSSSSSNKEKNRRHTVDNRSGHRVPMNGHQQQQQQQQKKAAVPALRESGGATKRHSERCHASQTDSTSVVVVKGVAERDLLLFNKAPKNLITTSGPTFRRHNHNPPPAAKKAWARGPGSGAGVRKGNGESCPPTAGVAMKEQQFESRQGVPPPSKGRSLLGATKGTRTTYGRRERESRDRNSEYGRRSDHMV